jgi:hypothetical protein
MVTLECRRALLTFRMSTLALSNSTENVYRNSCDPRPTKPAALKTCRYILSNVLTAPLGVASPVINILRVAILDREQFPSEPCRDHVVDVCAGLAPLRANPESLFVLDQLILGQANRIHKREAGPPLKLHTRFHAGGVARLQSGFAHRGEDGLVFFWLKWPHAIRFIRFDLDRGKLSGWIRSDQARLIAEFEKPFDFYLFPG